MNSGRLCIKFKNDVFASGHGHISICGEPAQPTVNGRRRRCVVDVDVVISGKIRIESQASKAALASPSSDIYRYKRRGEKGAIFNYPQPSPQLGDKNASIRCKRYACSCIHLRNLRAHETAWKPLGICQWPSSEGECYHQQRAL